MGLGWVGAPGHNRSLAAATHARLHFARSAKVPAGCGRVGEAVAGRVGGCGQAIRVRVGVGNRALE